MSADVSQALVDDLMNAVAARATKNYFDESAIAYEAARLARWPVVLVFYWTGAAGDDHANCNLFVAKGEAELFAHLRGESPPPEFEALFAFSPEAAAALSRALLHPAKAARLVAHDGQVI